MNWKFDYLDCIAEFGGGCGARRSAPYQSECRGGKDEPCRVHPEPKKRRAASSFIYTEVFKRVQQRHDIQIASETMDLTLRRPEDKNAAPEEERPAA